VLKWGVPLSWMSGKRAGKKRGGKNKLRKVQDVRVIANLEAIKKR